jgi:hypothetical protein
MSGSTPAFCLRLRTSSVLATFALAGCTSSPPANAPVPVAALQSSPDVVVAQGRSSCEPCNSDAQCSGAAVCAAMGKPAGSQGFFCLSSCAGGGPCATGFHCDTASTTRAKPAQVCIPDDNLCACTLATSTNGWSTPCFRVAYDPSGATLGRCDGTWTCSSTLGSCSAPMPATETCNGLDDDCDGLTDESASCDDGDPCTQDACTGGTCTHGTSTCGCHGDAECANANLCLGKFTCD